MRVDIAAVDDLLERTAAGFLARTRFGHQSVPALAVEAQPAARRDAAVSLQARGDVGGHQRAFDQQRAAAAHRVEQATAFAVDLRPVGAQQYRSGQVFLQRRLVLRHAPATAVHRATAQIDRDRGAALAQRQVDAHIRELHVHRRPFQALRAQAVDHAILDPLRGEARVGDLGAGHMRVHRQGQLGADVLLPRHRRHALVERALIRALELGQRPQHPAGQARPQHHALCLRQLALGVDAGNGGGGLVQAERQQFVGEQILQALGAGNKEFHGIGIAGQRRGGAHGHGKQPGTGSRGAIVREAGWIARLTARPAIPRRPGSTPPRGWPGGARRPPSAGAPSGPGPRR